METLRFTTTDREGRFRLANLNPGKCGVAVMRQRFDRLLPGLFDAMKMGEYAAVDLPLSEKNTQIQCGKISRVEFKLDEKNPLHSGRISGRVSFNNKPPKRAHITLWRDGNWKWKISAPVDQMGRYELDDVPAGDGRILELVYSPVSANKFSNQAWYGIRRGVCINEKTHLEENLEFLTGSIKGRVVHENGEPAFAIEIKASGKLIGSKGAVEICSYTELDGSFRLDGVPEGNYAIKIPHGLYKVLEPVSEILVSYAKVAGPVHITLPPEMR
jgi:hypothetical protein